MKRILRRTALGTAAVLTVALTGLVGFAPAQAETPPTTANFTAVFNENANGGIIAIGNSLLRCPLTVGTACTNALAGAAQDNNNFRMEDIDADGTAYNTINSSSSNLNLPDGATVLFAGLYWGARLDVGTTSGTMPVRAGDPAKANQIKFRLPNATSYESLTGEVIALNTGQKSAYQAYLDVTDLVRQGGNGAYWGADVETGTGLDRYAGWALVVAYSAPGLPLRNLTVYQGFKTVGSGAPADIEISDFLAPASGPVDVQLAMVAYEGDLAQTGDYARLNSAAGGTSLSTQLATPMSPGSNFFDSVNSLAGASVTTRDPAYKNMLGFDIKNLDASGTIPNGARTAQFSFRSAGDVYYPGVLALAINIYAPDFTSSTKTVVNVTSPKQPTNPGDTLQYTVMFANTGQDGATNAVGCDTLPAEVTYVPDSLWLLGTPDAAVDTPVKLPDNGDSFAKYDDATKTLCINLGRGAQAYKDGGGGALNILDATVYQFQVTVNEDAGGKTVSNTAHLSYKTQTEGLDAVYDPPPAVTEVGLKADVKIAKTMDPSPAIAGQAGVTTMTVTNLGPSQATGVQVSDPLPADYTATAVSYTIENPSMPGGTCPLPTSVNPVVECTLPVPLASGQRVVIKLEGAPESYSVATNLSNVASVTTTSFDPDLTNNVDVVSVPMTHQADLKITKDPSAQDITPGAEVSWRLTVTNKCDPSNPSACLSDATEVVITDTVADPARLVLTGATGGDGSGGIEGNVQVTCTSPVQPAAVRCSVVTSDGHGRLKPGQTATVEVTGYVPANVLSGTVVNNAAVTSATFDPNQLDNIATADLTPKNPISDIQVVKSGPATAIPGNRVDYSITATNWGPSDAVNVQFTDQLPAILTADSSTKVTTNRGTCAISGSKITCDIPDFPGPNTPGGTPANVTINITGALLAPSATASFTNTVAVTCGGTACVEGPNPKPDTPSVTTTPSPQADLAVSKTANVSQIPGAGDEVLYTVTVVNNGPSNASGVTLGDVLPGGMTVVGIAADNGGSCEATGPSCNLGNLAPGVGVEVAIRAKVDAGGLTPSGLTAYTQTATVTSNTPDPSGPNNTAEWEHKGGASPADLAILKISHGIEAGVTGDPSATGANVYELRVTNLGPATAHNVVVKDTLPTGLTFVASNPAGCTATGQEVTCLGTVLSSPGTASWNLAVKADQALAAGSLVTNTATVTADEPDPSLANNTSVAHDSVSAAADLVIDYEIGYGVYYDPGSPGVPILITDPTDARLPTHYTGPGSVRYVMVHVVNNGPAVARNVRGMSNVAVSAIPDANSLPPDCTTVNQQVVCDLGGSLGGNLETGEGFKFVFPFTISPSTPQNTSYPDCGRDNPCAAGTPGGWANAATSTPDPNLVNNYDTAGLVIGATETDLHVTKTALSTFVNADSHDAYTAGTKFGYRIDLWIPAGWDSVEEVSLPWGDAANVQLVDTLPTGFSATQVNTAQGTCDPIDPDSQTPVTSIRCDLGNVAASTNGKLGPDGKPLVAPRVVSVYVYGSIAPNVTAEISDGTGAKNVATANSATLDHLTGLATSKTALVEVDVVQQSDLAVTKLADAATSYAGANVGYTVTTVNNGPSDATNTKIVDTLAPGLTLDEAASPNCQVTGGSFAAGFEITCYPQFPGSPLGALPANQSVNTRIVTTSDPRDLRPYWCYGQNPDVTPVQTCPEVLPPTSLYLEHPRDLPNKVVVSSAALDSDPSNNKAEILTQMRTLADIAVAGSASSTSPAAGSTIKYTLTAVNLGPSALDNPKVVATFPPGFVPTAVEIGAMNCSISGPAGTPPGVYTVSCSNKPETPVRDSFQPGITAAGVVSVFIPADTPAGDYTAEAVTYSRSTEQCADPDNPPQNNNVGTCESNYANNTASVTVTVVDSADTALTKTLTSAVPLVAGSSVTYQLTVTNNGPSAAHDVTVADKVPAGMTFVSGQVQAGPACAVTDDPEEGNVVWCEVGTMAPHAQVTIDLTFQVGLHPAAQLCNTALVGSGALDPDPSNNQSGEICANTAPPPPTDVGVEVTAGTSPVLNGEPVSYTVVVTNHGPHPTTGAEVAITVPAHIVNPQVVVSTQTGQVQPGACTVSGSVFTCAIGDFWSGDTVTYAVTGTAGVVQDETLTVRAASSHDGTDADPTNDRDDASIDVDDHADLVLTKTLVSPAAPPLTAGGNVVYKLTATNAGPSAAEDVTIVDNVPDGLAFVSGPANCVATVQANGASVITCSLGKLAPSASTPVELTFKVAEAYRGQLCNAASVTSTTPDLTPGNNDATLCSNVVGPPTDVSVKVTADKPKIVTGDPVGYTVVVKNNGPSPTTGTKVIITVPPNVANPKVTVAGHTGSVVPGACTAVGSVVTCVIGDLAVGDTVTYRVAGTAQVTTARDLTLRAHVAHDDSDTDPSNDDSSAVIAVGVDSGLPVTGAGIVAPLALAALLVTLGVVLRSRRRRDLSLQ